jgi:hypothetical protein
MTFNDDNDNNDNNEKAPGLGSFFIIM